VSSVNGRWSQGRPMNDVGQAHAVLDCSTLTAGDTNVCFCTHPRCILHRTIAAAGHLPCESILVPCIPRDRIAFEGCAACDSKLCDRQTLHCVIRTPAKSGLLPASDMDYTFVSQFSGDGPKRRRLAKACDTCRSRKVSLTDRWYVCRR
jgi:hypothetical protein